jgi:hypothetical protein
MKSLEQQLQEHQASRPEMPRPFIPNSPEAIAWHKAFAVWAEVKHRLQCRLTAREAYREVKLSRRDLHERRGPWGGVA